MLLLETEERKGSSLSWRVSIVALPSSCREVTEREGGGLDIGSDGTSLSYIRKVPMVRTRCTKIAKIPKCGLVETLVSVWKCTPDIK